MMITLATLENMTNNDGMTLKGYRAKNYKSGYQVGLYGKETASAAEAMDFIVEYKGNCGVWFSDGIYYIDYSVRIPTKKEALRIGKEHNQQSILRWKDMSLIWLS